ncbi:emerin isoform X1 [Microcaecilia unicolor]|uniref:Emerin isoform X1 n=1 Tax=Microcaecilia unicolor TaxID=1415580 RepID=A0A6P7X326_9AMPH|nr:emerin isoform X1 [Microcaecilia unicolor]XP_030049977.1 emerin isoform X1 [Microcaecilia unicolor]XP_030049978.1 emerin isoform X1 [Microcaecilia unicolor]
MEKYKGMTDEELIASLKKYNIPHGPILKTTRKLYEKKIYAFESQRKRMPPMEVTYDDPDSGSHLYRSNRYYDSPAVEQYGRHSYPYGENDSEQMYEESFSTTKTYDAEPPRYRGTQEVFDSGNINRNYFSQNTYQDVSQYRTASSASPSLRVEPRKAIREKEEPQKRHLFPLWLQLFLLLLFIGFLALVYFFTQYKDENPFQILEE